MLSQTNDSIHFRSLLRLKNADWIEFFFSRNFNVWPIVSGGDGHDDDDDYDDISAGFPLPEHAFVCLARRSVN